MFAVIVATVLAHGFSLGPPARRFGLSVAADAERLAIVGASPWSSELALTLHGAGVLVLLVDTYPGACARPRNEACPPCRPNSYPARPRRA